MCSMMIGLLAACRMVRRRLRDLAPRCNGGSARVRQPAISVSSVWGHDERWYVMVRCKQGTANGGA